MWNLSWAIMRGLMELRCSRNMSSWIACAHTLSWFSLANYDKIPKFLLPNDVENLHFENWQHWFKQWLIDCRNQIITWTNIDLLFSLIRLYGIHSPKGNFKGNAQDISPCLDYWPFAKLIHQWLVPKEPVMWKVSPCQPMFFDIHFYVSYSLLQVSIQNICVDLLMVHVSGHDFHVKITWCCHILNMMIIKNKICYQLLFKGCVTWFLWCFLHDSFSVYLVSTLSSFHRLPALQFSALVQLNYSWR